MQAKLLIFVLAAVMLAGSLGWTATAHAQQRRGYFGPINETYFRGRGGAQYYRTYPQRPYPYRANPQGVIVPTPGFYVPGPPIYYY
jgi:hypothetical protein